LATCSLHNYEPTLSPDTLRGLQTLERQGLVRRQWDGGAEMDFYFLTAAGQQALRQAPNSAAPESSGMRGGDSHGWSLRLEHRLLGLWRREAGLRTRIRAGLKVLT